MPSSLDISSAGAGLQTPAASGRRRVLLVSYYYPPSAAVGALRPRGLAKYLPEFGWDAVVLTRRLAVPREPSPAVVETDYRDVVAAWKQRLGLNPQRQLREQLSLSVPSGPGPRPLRSRVVDWIKLLLTYPDETKGWLPFARQAVEALSRESGFDAILTTAHPISAHLLGAHAKTLLGCPWLADFRDLWVQNPNNPYRGILGLAQRRLERTTLAQADLLVTVSGPLCDLLRERYPQKPAHAIPNGFDPEDFAGEAGPPSPFFNLVYTGQLYEGKRDPSPLLFVLKEMMDRGELPRQQLRVQFYGPQEPWFAARVRELALADVVELHGSLPRAQALRCQKEAQLLLLLGWEGSGGAGIFTGKFFEYLGAARPILMLGGERGVIADVLEETRAGIQPRHAEELKQFLRSAYRQFRDQGVVAYEGIDARIQRYTHREMARQFAVLLDQACATSAYASRRSKVRQS